MVTIVDYKTYQKEDGTEFYALVVQGGIETVKSKETGRNYFTARQAVVTCTFTEETCKSLIGKEMPGGIRRVEVEPYQYTIRETGEVVTLSHRQEYLSEEESIIKDNVVEKEAVV